MNDKNYSKFLESLKDVPEVPADICDSVIIGAKKRALVTRSVRISASVAAILLFSIIIFQNQYNQNSMEVTSNSNIETLLEDSDYDNFDDYYPLANL
jgi:hypothetical protein